MWGCLSLPSSLGFQLFFSSFLRFPLRLFHGHTHRSGFGTATRAIGPGHPGRSEHGMSQVHQAKPNQVQIDSDRTVRHRGALSERFHY